MARVAFLQLLIETGMRCGEAWLLRWIDFNFDARTVNVTPEKGSNPRQLKLSEKCLAMLTFLDKSQPKVFQGSLIHFARSFRRQRKGIALKMGNPRINKITFLIFRHFKGSMEYRKTRYLPHVQQILGHNSMWSTMIYTHMVNFEAYDFYSATAKTVEETQKLVEAGFEYVCSFDDVKVFRKPK